MKPVLFATGHVPPYRAGELARLHELEGIEVALFGGRSHHGGDSLPSADFGFPWARVNSARLARLAASGRYRAVVCPTGGRIAPLALAAGARGARVPLLLWASLWAHPRSAFHLLSYMPLRRLYRRADAVVTYGPHVSSYVRARGAGNVHVARQSVDNDYWRAAQAPSALTPWATQAAVRFLFVGRPAREKGAQVLLAAWRHAGLRPPAAALVLAGAAAGASHGGLAAGVASTGEGERAGPAGQATGVLELAHMPAGELRALYEACDVLVVPSIATRTFREPWGLVVNEAMNRGIPVIASDAVGAAAGGLVCDGRNGLVVAAGDAAALAAAISRLARDTQARRRMGAAAAEDVLGYTHDSWAQGFSEALASVGVSRARC